jgi:hypothetical protein
VYYYLSSVINIISEENRGFYESNHIAADEEIVNLFQGFKVNNKPDYDANIALVHTLLNYRLSLGFQ